MPEMKFDKQNKLLSLRVGSVSNQANNNFMCRYLRKKFFFQIEIFST